MTCRTLLIALCLGPSIVFGQTDPETRLNDLQAQYEQLTEQQRLLLAPIEQAKLEVMQRDLAAVGLPALAPGDEVVIHPGHSLVWSEQHLQPKWTAHIVVSDILQGNLARIDSFTTDPLVKGNTNLYKDYWKSGYDRGHMVPSADMRWSLNAMTATYMYSNISPQAPDLNRGAWAELEDWVRRCVHYGNERVFVVTGPVLTEGLPLLNRPTSPDEVSVPKLFFKVIADLDGEERKGIAFLMSNGMNDRSVMSYAVSIDSVEALTGIDFFAELDEATEQRIESMSDPKAFVFKGDPFFGEAEPLKAPLPKGMLNTMQARHHVGNTATVCGTVVSTRHTQKANAIYLNMDRVHPHQDFYATVWDYNGPNFSYDPETYLINKVVCITGKITLYDDIPRISVNNESEIILWEEIEP